MVSINYTKWTWKNLFARVIFTNLVDSREVLLYWTPREDTTGGITADFCLLMDLYSPQNVSYPEILERLRGGTYLDLIDFTSDQCWYVVQPWCASRKTGRIIPRAISVPLSPPLLLKKQFKQPKDIDPNRQIYLLRCSKLVQQSHVQNLFRGVRCSCNCTEKWRQASYQNLNLEGIKNLKNYRSDTNEWTQRLDLKLWGSLYYQWHLLAACGNSNASEGRR